jgi:hypothetical protein
MQKGNGYDTDLNPNEGQVYAEYLIKDLLNTNPQRRAAHHYWIHIMENCGWRRPRGTTKTAAYHCEHSMNY